jgi:hypothetical protein
MKLPYYCKIFETPIFVTEENGKIIHYVFDWKKGGLYSSIRFDNEPLGGIAGSEANLDELTKEEFEKQLVKSKNRFNINKELPVFCIYNEKAIKIANIDGMFNSQIPAFFVLNETTGEFDRDNNYREAAYREKGNVKYVSEDEFNDYVKSRIA